MEVQITQFIRPNGRQLLLTISIDDKCKDKYADILACNSQLTVEELMNGTMSQTIECSEFDFDIILTNGSEEEERLKPALEEMILRFDKDACLQQQSEFAQATGAA